MTLLIIIGGAGGGVVAIDTSVTFTIFIPPDDLSVTVPEEKTVYTTVTDTRAIPEAAELRVTPEGEQRVVSTFENVYVLYVPADDYSVIVSEET